MGAALTDTPLDAAAQLALLMAHVRQGVVMYDADESIMLINDRVPTIFGFARGSISIGSTLGGYLASVGRAVGWPAERVARVLDNHRSWSRQGVPQRFDHVFDSGKIFEVTFDPIAAGGAILTFLDVTHERMMHRRSDSRDALARQSGTMLATVARISADTRNLALNASIEAARLGDLGRGFAVVAAAIRELSRETSAVLVEMARVNEELLR